jgi:hypothetical protein
MIYTSRSGHGTDSFVEEELTTFEAVLVGMRRQPPNKGMELTVALGVIRASHCRFREVSFDDPVGRSRLVAVIVGIS